VNGKMPDSSGDSSNELPDLMQQVGLLLGRSYYSYLQLMAGLLAQMDLSDKLKPGMTNVLYVLWERDDRTMGEITQRLQLSKSTLTRLVRSVEVAGLVETRRDPEDRRSIRVKLTPQASALKDSAYELGRRVESILVEDLEEGEAETLRRLLTKMNETIARRVEEFDS